MISEELTEINETEEPTEQRIVSEDFDLYRYSDLTDADKQPPEFIIEGMIPVGMTFLSGPPKTRKSFMALQMALSVSTGSPFFGRKTTPCDVVYFDLEGSKSRIANRVSDMSIDPPENLYFVHRTDFKVAESGRLADRLRILHHDNPALRLIIIDTYSRARGRYRPMGENAYDADVAILETMQRMALEEKIAVLFVHHDKKGASFVKDDFERLNGTMGIGGSADCVINLIADSKRADGTAKLSWTPRDAEGGEIDIQFIPSRREWMEIPRTEIVTKNTAVGGWIIANAPAPRKEGVFFSYEQVYFDVYGTLAYDRNAGTKKIVEQVMGLRRDLFDRHGIGVQLAVKSNGARGIRIINLQ